ncbi:RHS repeat-associated core domain-containing protein [Bacteroides sedimenti]
MVLFRNCIRTINHPSGLPWGESEGANVQPYKYNGKEFIEMHGYDTYDYGARGYYPAIQRFTSIDPLAEKYYSISPYAFYSNNSINSIDLDGMDDYKINSDGRIWLWRETKDKTDRLIAIGNKNVVNVDKARKILNNNIIVTDKIILPSLSKTNADDESVTGVTTLMFENKNILFEVHSHSKEN